MKLKKHVLAALVLFAAAVSQADRILEAMTSDEGWKPGGNNTEGDVSFQSGEMSVQMTFRNEAREIFTLSKRYGADLDGARFLRFKALVPKESFLTLDVTVNGQTSRALAYRNGTGQWEAISIPLKGDTLNDLTFSFGEPGHKIDTGDGPRTVRIQALSLAGSAGAVAASSPAPTPSPVSGSGSVVAILDAFKDAEGWSANPGGNPDAGFRAEGNAMVVEVDYDDSRRDLYAISKRFTWPEADFDTLNVQILIPKGAFFGIDADIPGGMARLLSYREGNGKEQTLSIPLAQGKPNRALSLSFGEPKERAATGTGLRTFRLLKIWVEKAPRTGSSQIVPRLNGDGTWRSALYPSDWKPGFADGQGRFLHDYSYAGYRMGQAPPSNPPGKTCDVTQPPYGADPGGKADSTWAIQAALEDASAAGGGIVFLPPGTYRVLPPYAYSGKLFNAILHVSNSGVVLKGAGSSRTFLFVDDGNMRDRYVIRIKPPGRGDPWHSLNRDAVSISRDLMGPTAVIPVKDASPWRVGEWVVLRQDVTPEWVAEHDMEGVWNSSMGGVAFYRRILAVDKGQQTITVDVPTRYPLRVRDGARVVRTVPHLEECGVEGLSIGMRENPKALAATFINDLEQAIPPDTLRMDHAMGWYGGHPPVKPEDPAYEIHGAYMLGMNHVVNGWVRDVKSYRPAVNTLDLHIAGNGFIFDYCRFLTVTNCEVKNPLFVGGGGNGYGYSLGGEECLIVDSRASRMRHSFSHRYMQTSGNVILQCTTRNGFTSDWHMMLSMANLYDSHTLDADYLEAIAYRAPQLGHGHVTTQSVIWNTRGVNPNPFKLGYAKDNQFLIYTDQFSNGYVIGTRGPAAKVKSDGPDNGGPTDPTPDWVEGVGMGDTLVPPSLYEDQVRRRKERERP